jgi:hypothetical protein
MDEAARRRADELFQRYMAEARDPRSVTAKSEIARQRAQSFAGIDLSSGSFCTQGPRITEEIRKELATWSFFIPDSFEIPARVVLRVLIEVVFPEFCGAATATAAPTTPSAPASTPPPTSPAPAPPRR